MFKEIITCVFLLIAIIFPNILYASSTFHLEQLKRKYPYMILSDDYEILNEDDLIMNTCVAHSAPFSEDNYSSFYWKCFKTKNVTAKCKKGRYEPHDGITLSDATITVKEGQTQNLYFSRRRNDFEICLDQTLKINKAMKNQDYVCISGEFSGYGNPAHPSDEKDQHFVNWIYDKLKTPKECVSYFDGYCDVKFWQRDGCEAVTKKYGKALGKK